MQQYATVTGSYWAFTLTDGALRMLVVLHFHQLGYSPLEIALLFLFYEFFGVVTNLVGGWLGAHIGLNKTMHIGMGLQIIALSMLLVDSSMLSVPYVMAAQALSGIAKDLNKMSAKSSLKILLPPSAEEGESKLYRWVAVLTGSKNALKGVGFFMGGALLAAFGFHWSIITMIVLLSVALLMALILLKQDLGKSQFKPKFAHIFSKSGPVNILSGARLFLFGARDVWFVVAIPVFFSMQLGWSHTEVGSFMAAWVIGYGFIQGLAPIITGIKRGKTPHGSTAVFWTGLLSLSPAAIALLLGYADRADFILVIGLLIFGVLFAINSAVHSYLILSYAKADGVSLDVGFYYMANAMGRLIGTVLSGYVFQAYGLEACLYVSSAFLIIATIASLSLPKNISPVTTP